LKETILAWADTDQTELVYRLMGCYEVRQLDVKDCQREGSVLSDQLFHQRKIHTKLKKAFSDLKNAIGSDSDRHDFEIPFSQRDALALFDSATEGDGYNRRTRLSKFLTFVGDLYGRNGQMRHAFARYCAAWAIDPRNCDVAVKAAVQL